MKTYRRIFLVISVLSFLVLSLSQCISKKETNHDPRGNEYTGSYQCSNCHGNIHNSYINTAHNNSSAVASKQTVKGSFASGENEYYYRPNVKVAMMQWDSSLFQVAYKNNLEKQSNRFDIVIGSGRKAQTYFYWNGDNVYQLPVSWFVPAHSWVNSPGYPPHQVRFDRNIPIGCFECHSSFIKLKSNRVVESRVINDFDRNSIIYGIDCERCHGPAAEHVSFHKEHPYEKQPKHIVSLSSLTRQQKTDMCAQCHSGIQQTLKSIFNFRPGDTLVNNFFGPPANINVADLDVHGNQKQLLTASQCFIKTRTLTCSSCHNPHVNERENLALFSQRCISCHSEVNHSFGAMASSLRNEINNNCIDCHMPAKPSKSITMLSNGQASPTPNLIRTHFITIYQEETKKFLASKK